MISRIAFAALCLLLFLGVVLAIVGKSNRYFFGTYGSTAEKHRDLFFLVVYIAIILFGAITITTHAYGLVFWSFVVFCAFAVLVYRSIQREF